MPFPFALWKPGAAVFDPATLSLDAWYRASYAGSPWSPTASAGNSGTNGTLVTSGVAPGVGTAVNGLDPASFDGSTKSLTSGTAATSDFVTVSALTTVVLFKAAASVAAATDFYDDPTLTGDGGGNWGLVFTSSGVRAGLFDTATKQTTSIAMATGAWFMAAMRLDGGNLKCRVSQASGTTDATPVAAGNIASLHAAPFFGRNYAGAKWIQGDILEIMESKTALSDANLVSLRSYFNSRYALSLG